MTTEEKHALALKHITDLYQAGWIPIQPHNSNMPPTFSCVVDPEKIVLATLYLNDEGQWLFKFTLGLDSHEFTTGEIPTVKQVRYTYQHYQRLLLNLN